MIRRLLRVFIVVAPCTACASMATQARVARSVAIVEARGTPSMRRVFTSHLSGGDSLLPSIVPTIGGSRAWGTVRIVVNDDDSFEYLATIYNPVGEAFTGAVLCRGADIGSEDVVATLFSDVALRSRYIQLRGTVSVARGVNAGVLAEELREDPRGFAISVNTATKPGRFAIRGFIE
ncbi:MAG: CHRD domain-containing protein [Gemmatimonadota bacterium]